ncbi:hypothetical protein BJY16_008565 [Actinoplanes octamycinicus]|uniref:Uncharacterized protein n=1 Tax=Actinoplanes octamycinicus TaxID=135948 RepID=A0A7W7H6X5_9ACTN|nr:SitI3 family protein [Actinoplanes octamycinicus]MBB4745106.1 hypothetical protein [Actinoplanes octamycinicus]GIE55690.1 hypothetical protein Aoc01nite_10920 [Actinoplanes octamycinicus]
MAIEYRFTIAGSTPVAEIAQRAFPYPADRPVEYPGGKPGLLFADLRETAGFSVTIRAGENGYLQAESDDGMWEWESSIYVRMTFRLTNGADVDRALSAMLTAVQRTVKSGHEDVVLDLNGNWLLLTRIDGVLAKHKLADWWNLHQVAGLIGPT